MTITQISEHGATAIIKRYTPLVRKLAQRMAMKLPASVDLNDLIQAGAIGLLEAATRYEDVSGASFETYAAQRINGAMLDELRGSDWAPRGLRKAQRALEKALHQAQQVLGRSPSESEMAARLGMTLGEYQALLSDLQGAQLLYYEDFGETHGDELFVERHYRHDADPLSLLEDRDLRQCLVTEMQRLSEREQQVMSMYYERDLTLREIALVLGVSESRVCQIHTSAVAKLRARLRVPARCAEAA